MKDLSSRCIFGGSSKNLNTTMEVTLDGEKYKVSISEEYEDDASLGAIKRLIPKHIAAMEKTKAEMLLKFEEFRAMASELGFDLVKKGESLIVEPEEKRRIGDPNALSDKPIVNVGGAEFKMQKDTRSNNKAKEEGMTKEEASSSIKRAEREAQNTQGLKRPTAGDAAPFIQHKLPKTVTVQTPEGQKVVRAPQKGAQKMQTVRGAAGIPTAIPRSLYSSDGETTITVVNTGGDKTIQMRGRQLGQMREQGQGGFYSQNCGPCQGTGLHARRRCKACDGSGIII